MKKYKALLPELSVVHSARERGLSSEKQQQEKSGIAALFAYGRLEGESSLLSHFLTFAPLPD